MAPSAQPPSLSDLLSRYLQRQKEKASAGWQVSAAGEVVPFEAVVVQPVDPRLAWEEANFVARYYPRPLDLTEEPPADWPSVVSCQEPQVAAPLCLGNFPQLVRDLNGLIRSVEAGTPTMAGSQPLGNDSLEDWANETGTLQSVAVLRLARRFSSAERLLAEVEKKGTTSAEAVGNERASLLWHQGQHDRACDIWNELPECVPVLFNRGLACLFGGKKKDASELLKQAISQLPEESAWHHLGQLYQALAR
ncbi:MAG: hypothetical protein KatS3mg105_1709 [Gemmatales bacterium]|nr:MAG: hypothetical protein KatS3mg105_1709 [Gemmatales bacterium]